MRYAMPRPSFDISSTHPADTRPLTKSVGSIFKAIAEMMMTCATDADSSLGRAVAGMASC
jgi:hypothetical protein